MCVDEVEVKRNYSLGRNSSIYKVVPSDKLDKVGAVVEVVLQAVVWKGGLNKVSDLKQIHATTGITHSFCHIKDSLVE